MSTPTDDLSDVPESAAETPPTKASGTDVGADGAVAADVAEQPELTDEVERVGESDLVDKPEQTELADEAELTDEAELGNEAESADETERADEIEYADETESSDEAEQPDESAQPDEAGVVVAPEEATAPAEPTPEPALRLVGVAKSFGGNHAVAGIDLEVPRGMYYGLLGPNGAGKTTTLSMIAGLLRPDHGTIHIAGENLLTSPRKAKARMGVLPDRLRTFDRLTGRQLLYYTGKLREMSTGDIADRTADLAAALDLTDSLGRVVADYSAGMTKKLMLAAAMIHSPEVLVLDEPFESVDPASAKHVLNILDAYVDGGGTVVLSSHGMDLIEMVCSRVAILVAGQILDEGTVAEVTGDQTLEQRFVDLSGGLTEVEGLEWLHSFSA